MPGKIPNTYCNWCGYKWEWVTQKGKLSMEQHKNRECCKEVDPAKNQLLLGVVILLVISIWIVIGYNVGVWIGVWIGN